MDRNTATTERLRNLISKIEATTKSGELHWDVRPVRRIDMRV